MLRWLNPRAAEGPNWSMHAISTLAAIGAIELASQAATLASVQSTAPAVYTMTPGRLGASTAAVTALIGAIAGGVALARAGRLGDGKGRRGAIAALVLGPIGLLGGALIVATADGGVGTGNGYAGGVVAMVIGAIGITLGGLALTRSPRAG